MRFCISCTIIFLVILKCFAQDTSLLNAPEKVLYNAKIFTGNRNQPFCTAIAIKGNKIVEIGSLNKVKQKVSAQAKFINLHGAVILPGLIDSHNHGIEGGEQLLQANVFDELISVDSLHKYLQFAVQKGIAQQGDFWVVNGLNIATWSNIEQLRSIFNSNVYANQPIVLKGSDGHTLWANQAALNRAGITSTYLQTMGKRLVAYYGIDSTGNPNGFIADSGMANLRKVIPTHKIDWQLATQKALQYNNSLGITAWLDPAVANLNSQKFEYYDAYKQAALNNTLTAHIASVVVADANNSAEKQIAAVKDLQKETNDCHNFKINGFKIFADGVLEHPSQTASISIPYLNSGKSGTLMVHPDSLLKFIEQADKENLLVHIHAIGDKAVTVSIDAIANARIKNLQSHIPHTITHLQLINPKDFKRFRQYEILASMQLLWAFGDVTTIDIVRPYIHASLFKWQYPAKSIWNYGATICGASDWPVSSANPFEAIARAESRTGPKGVLNAAEKMPRVEMLYAYTINAAKALQWEHTIGSLEKGKLADLILVDKNVFNVSVEELYETQVLWTMFEGKIVYKR